MKLKLNNQLISSKNEKIKISLISLGCEKNLVDSELILGLINTNKQAFTIVQKVEEADAVLINTCGFINSAKEEAIDTIFDCLNIKEEKRKLDIDFKVIVCGCLTQRYYEDLKQNEDLEEVDLWIPIQDYFKMGQLINQLYKLDEDHSFKQNAIDTKNRLISTGNALAYVRISEGCNNRCAYCAIPLIRGNFVSRSHSDIVREVKELVQEGYQEICLISQDLSNYGFDIHDTLASLLRDIDFIEGDYSIRLLYLYPDEITDEFIDVVAQSKHIMHYFDIPLQHGQNRILKLMNRRGTKEEAIQLINKIREKMSDAIIRTTMIVGFPHETENDFLALLDFVKQVKFNHLGAFTYSKEEDTTSYNMTCQVSKKAKIDRYNRLMETQKWISYEKNKEFIGKTLKCLVEDYNDDEDYYQARSYIQAPDDIDGGLTVTSDKILEIGKVYEVTITDCDFYDMKGIVK